MKPTTKKKDDTVSRIASRIMVCNFRTGAWRGKHRDTNEAAKVNRDAGAMGAASVTVDMMAGANSKLAEITKNFANAYAAHKALTLPSCQDGLRVIPSGKEFEHAETMKAFREKHDSLVSDFMAEYENCKQTAPVRLGSLYQPDKWPDLASIQNSFKFRNSYYPCPTEGAWTDWIKETADIATMDFRETLYSALERVAERCASDGKLHASVFENIRDICAMAGAMNIADDPMIKEVAEKAAPLGNLDAEILRENKTARADAATAAKNLFSYFGK